MASQVLDGEDYIPSSSSSSLLTLGDDRESLAAAERTVTKASSACLSIASISRAEQQLRHAVQLHRGGTCVRFTREDIAAIHDPELLQFLAGCSEPIKPTKPEVKEAEQQSLSDGATSPLPPSISAAAIEAEMEALQREIDTFITAVDSDGKTYEIQIGSNGRVEVPIQDEAASENANLEEDSDDDEGNTTAADTSALLEETDDEEPSASETSVSLAAVAPNPKRKAGDVATTRLQPSQRPFRRPAAITTSRRAAPKLQQPPAPPPVCSGRVRPAKETALFKRTGANRTRRANAVQPDPAVSVKPQVGLTAEEESRVDLLLLQDFTAALDGVPYRLKQEQVIRLSQLDDEISAYREVRGATESTPASPTSEANQTILQRKDGPTGDTANSQMTSGRRLGNHYMIEARQEELRMQKLRSVNQRLEQLHRIAEELQLQPSPDVPDDVASLRPQWSKLKNFTVPTEEEIQEMLRAAREEDIRATERGLAAAASHVSNASELQNHLRAICSRATELVEELQSQPLALKDCIPVAVPTDDQTDMSSTTSTFTEG